jgi:hypothetical protein
MQKLRHPSEVDALFGGQWRRRSLLSVGDLGTCRALAGPRGGRHLREIVVRRAGPGRDHQRMGTALTCGC